MCAHDPLKRFEMNEVVTKLQEIANQEDAAASEKIGRLLPSPEESQEIYISFAFSKFTPFSIVLTRTVLSVT